MGIADEPRLFHASALEALERLEMAKKVRMEFVNKGFREILMSDNLYKVTGEAGKKIANYANLAMPYSAKREEDLPKNGLRWFNYHSAYLKYGGGRLGGYVDCGAYLARLAQAKEKTLERAVHK